MEFTSTELLAMLTLLGSVIVNIIQAWKISPVVTKIEANVNSAASEARARRDADEKTIGALTAALADAKETAKLLAQAAAAHPTVVNGASAVVERKAEL